MLRRSVGRLVDLYVVGVVGWAAAWRLLGDAWGGLGLINSWAFWWLATGLPMGFLRLRKRSAWLAGGWLLGGAAVLLSRYSLPGVIPLLWATRRRAGTVPAEAAPQHAAPAEIRVYSHNLLMENKDLPSIASAIERAVPDVVLLQEVEPDIFAGLADCNVLP
jgi:hypothetical protein